MLDNNFWKKYFKTYDLLNRAIPYQEVLNDIYHEARPKKGQMVLDAGSGTGNLSLIMSQSGAKVIGLDFSREGIKLHQKKDPSAEVIHGDLTKKLPFQDESFDCIVSNNVIYTLDKKLRRMVFAEFYRILKKGGVIVVSNIHKGFSPAQIFKEHLKRHLKEHGIIKTLIDLSILGSSVIRMFYYNYLIKKEHSSGSYDFMDEGDQSRLLVESGFKLRGKTRITYARQAYLDVGTK
jgi:ubiquinone/menaquinone biosynthesis C-methylase UbiE